MKLYASILSSFVFASIASLDLISSEGAAVTVNGLETIINSSQSSHLEWSRFDLNANETVNFVFPNEHGVSLNIINGQPSSIEGTILSNGNVHLINKAGIIFGEGATIDVAGLQANGEFVDFAGNIAAKKLEILSKNDIRLSGNIDLEKLVLSSAGSEAIINIDTPLNFQRITHDDKEINIVASEVNINSNVDLSGENAGGELRIAADTLNINQPINARNGFIAIGAKNLIMNAEIDSTGGYIYQGDADYVMTPPNPLRGANYNSNNHFEPFKNGYIEVKDGKHTGIILNDEYYLDENNAINFGKLIAVGVDKKNSYSNYYTEQGSYENVAHYDSLEAKNIQDGIDLRIYHNRQGQSEFDLIVNKGANPADIRLSTNSVLEKSGESLKIGKHVLAPPLAYQEISGTRRIVRAEYDVTNAIKFKIDKYDTNSTLVIDPILTNTAYNPNTKENEYDHDIVRLDDNSLVLVQSDQDMSFAGVDPGQGYYFATKGANRGLVFAKFDETYTLSFLTYITATENIFTTKVAANSNNDIYIATNINNSGVLNGVGDLSAKGSFAPDPIANDSEGHGVLMKFSSDGRFENAGYIDINGTNVLVYDLAVDYSSRPVIYGKFDEAVNLNSATFVELPLLDDSNPADNDDKHFVARFNSSLTGKAGHRILAQVGNEQYNQLAVSPKNSIVVAGRLSGNTTTPATIGQSPASTQTASNNVYVAMLDSNFNIIHQHVIGTAPNNAQVNPGGVAVDENENTYVALDIGTDLAAPEDNTVTGFSNTNGGILIRKFSPAGKLLAQTYDGNQTQISSNDPRKILARDGSVILMGYTYGPGPITLQNEEFGSPLAESGNVGRERPVFVIKYSDDLMERQFADVINSNTHNNTFFLYSQSTLSSMKFNSKSTIDFYMGTDMTNLPTSMPNLGTNPVFNNAHGGARFAGYIGNLNFDLRPLSELVTADVAQSIFNSPLLRISNSTLRYYINTKDSIDILFLLSFFKGLLNDQGLNNVIISKSLSKNEIKRIEVIDEEGMWVFEDNRWVYKKKKTN